MVRVPAATAHNCPPPAARTCVSNDGRRMTADSPEGEYLELVPKEAQLEIAPKRAVYSRGKAAPLQKSDDTTPSPTKADSERGAPHVELSNTVRVLKPAKVESWQASSFDLLTGCQVRDVTDTIPGDLYDKLFTDGS